MRQLIQFHVDDNQEAQQQLERDFAEQIESRFRRNIRAFSQSIPSVVDVLNSGAPQRLSLFVNKYGEANIVDYTNGRVLYGMRPPSEMQRHVDDFRRNALHVSLTETIATSDDSLEWLERRKPLPNKIDVLVVLGVGLGSPIQRLIEHHDIAHIIIYEPSVDYFKCANFALDWQSILATCKRKSTALYLQVGKDGANLVNDINELKQHFKFDGFYIYKHLQMPVFDSICSQLSNHTWANNENKPLAIQHQYNAIDFCSQWVGKGIPKTLQVESKNSVVFEKNIAAFERFFPDIAKQFSDYKPRCWLPVREVDGQFNILNTRAQSLYSDHDPQSVAEQEFGFFSRYPNKNGLVLGYKGEKLKHYVHYQFVVKTEQLIDSVEEEVAQLPKFIKSFILFGLGNGNILQELLHNHDVEKLFICEPNNDFFYASLFNIDWDGILTKLDEQDRHLYINVGDDGSHLTKDLIKQFYSLGPYLLAQTYIYQSYVNDVVDAALSNLQEQLKFLLSMGDYFDHAFYGINQTREVIQRGAPILLNNPAQRLTSEERNVPVVLVGNGPSLDESIVALREIADEAIIVSCGTALKTLYEYDITPDFHCEIEQNRATFDWASRVGSFNFLKKVSLLSCNGIHPDTCSLYKDVFLCFKEGEASTVTWTSVINKNVLHILPFAFPTVANLALDFFSALLPSELYLVGVDLGYRDLKKHHSNTSAYYDDKGEELYDYVSKNYSVLQVQGNFDPFVYTKHEFKISKMVMEETLEGRNLDVYNCSNGAFIEGTKPLHIENILVATTSDQKAATVNAYKDKLFTSQFNTAAVKQFDDKFNIEALVDDLHKIQKAVDDAAENAAEVDIDVFLEQQRQILVDSVQQNTSLLFYYLYGSVNYASAVLSKLNYANTQVKQQCVPECLNKWRDCIDTIVDMFTDSPQIFDQSSSMRWLRTKSITKSSLNNSKLLVITNSASYIDAFKYGLGQRDFDMDVTFKPMNTLDNDEKSRLTEEKFEHVLYVYNNQHHDGGFFQKLKDNQEVLVKPSTGQTKVLFEQDLLGDWTQNYYDTTFCQITGDLDYGSDLAFNTKLNTVFHTIYLLCDVSAANIVLPKAMAKENGRAYDIRKSQPELYSCGVDWYESQNWLIGFYPTHKSSTAFDGFGDPLQGIQAEQLSSRSIVSYVDKEYVNEALRRAKESRPFIITERPYVQ